MVCVTDKPGSTGDPTHFCFSAYFHWKTEQTLPKTSQVFLRFCVPRRCRCTEKLLCPAWWEPHGPTDHPGLRVPSCPAHPRPPWNNQGFDGESKAPMGHSGPRWSIEGLDGAFRAAMSLQEAGAEAAGAKARPARPGSAHGPQRSPQRLRVLPASAFPFLFSSPPPLPSFLSFPSLFPFLSSSLPAPPAVPRLSAPPAVPPARPGPALPSPGTSWRWFPMLSRGSPPRSSAAIAVYPESSLGRRRGGGRRRAEEEPGAAGEAPGVRGRGLRAHPGFSDRSRGSH